MNFLGIDLGGTQIRTALVSEAGEVSEEKTAETVAQDGEEKIIERLFNLIEQYDDFEAIGIGVPGPIDYEAGIVLNPPNLPFRNFELRKIIEEKFNVPVAMDRDANCALIGEHWMGEAKGLKNVAMVTWGTGVGGAVIIDNQIYRGHSDIAGEIGHMIIDKDGPECAMGHHGCLESLIGGAAIEKKNGRSLKEICEGARNKNEEDLKIMVEVGSFLKIGLENIVTLFDPELIILDGSVMRSADVFLKYIEDLPVKVSENALKAGIFGAARIGMDVGKL